MHFGKQIESLSRPGFRAREEPFGYLLNDVDEVSSFITSALMH